MVTLQGFEEVKLTVPVGKIVMTVTDSVVRFNKATAAALGYPAYVKVLVNNATRQVALEVTTGKATNGVKFSKPEGKQNTSVTVRDPAVLRAVGAFFTMPEAPEGEIPYQAVKGTLLNGDRAVVFDVADAEPGTMKKRGRKVTPHVA